MDAQASTQQSSVSPSAAADQFRIVNDEAVKVLQEAAQRDAAQQIDMLQEHVDKVEEFRGKDFEVKAREQILTKKLDELHADDAAYETALGKAVFSLQSMLEELGKEYSALEELSSEEKGMVADTEREVEHAGHALFGRERKVAAAKAALAAVKTKVEGMRRNRVLDANMEQQLQRFMLLSDRTKDLIAQRMKKASVILSQVSDRKVKALAAKVEATNAFNTLDKELEAARLSLQTEEEVLNGLPANSNEHAEKETEIAELRKKLTETEASRNNAFSVMQSKEKFSKALEVHEQSQIRLKSNLTIWHNVLQSDTEERVVTFRSRLEAMKEYTDQIAAKKIDDMGAKIDEDNTLAMATMGAAADRNTIDRIQKMPERIRNTDAIRAAQLEAQRRVMADMSDALEQWRQSYGVDPLSTQFSAAPETAEANALA